MKDVVCGMDVDPDSAAAIAEYKGATYYFCAPGCRTDFESDPEKYLAPSYVPEGMGDEIPAKRWWEFWKD